MKRFKKTLAVIAATSIVSVAIFAHAGEDYEQTSRHHHFNGDKPDGHAFKHRHRGHDRAPFEDVLNLTDAQKQTLEAARAAQEPARKDAREKLRAAHEALSNAGDQNADDATLNKLANDLASLIAQKEVERIKAHRAFLNVLTPEQKEKLEAFKTEHKSSAPWKNKQKSTSSTPTKG